MREPFYRSSRSLNTIALIVAIVAIIIFISSCLLNVYAYASNPTATPTSTNTPTITNTPRPTRTPTATATPVVTPTIITPTGSVTLPAEIAPEEYTLLESTFAERGYDCSLNAVETAAFVIVCQRFTADLAFQIEMTTDEEGMFTAAIILTPYSLDISGETLEEIVWLVQSPHRFPWLYETQLANTVTVSPSPPTEEPDPASQWIRVNLPLLTEGSPIDETIEGLDHSMRIESQALLIQISTSTEETTPE